MKKALLAALAVCALAMPHANAASTAFVVNDATGDAYFKGVHNQSLPAGSQPGFDIVSATFDTTKVTTTTIVKKKKVTVVTPTGIVITLKMAGPPSTAPSSSYGITAQHSACGLLRMQIYYSATGAETYGDLEKCGVNDDPTSTNPEQFAMTFSPKVSGNNLIISISFKALPKQFKVGTLVDEITAYTSNAEFVLAGYQPTDFEPSAGIDIATAATAWKIK
ncbi:MAG: hypothetical protein QOE45_3403 [Frankiaceae bacterium]|nr:hypothetical protein [Frankiaceae bacterium]